MQQALKAVCEFLQANNYSDSLESLRSELLQSIPQEPSLQLLRVIENVSLASNEAPEKNRSERPSKQPRGIASRLYSQEQADGLMESLMTRIANNPNLLNDSNLNRRIQNIMDNKVFLKLVENTDVFQEEQSQPSVSRFSRRHSRTEDHFQDELELVVPPQPRPNLSKTNKVSQSQISFIEHGDLAADESMVSRPELLQSRNAAEQDGVVGGSRIDAYDIYEFNGKTVRKGIPELALSKGYPQEALRRSVQSMVYPGKRITRLPQSVAFPDSEDDHFPVEYNGTIYDCFKLKVIYNRERTGYEESSHFPIVLNDVIAGRYQIVEVLGAGAFATVMKVLDLMHEGKEPRWVCLKMIENENNGKDHFDQALDEIRILRYVDSNCDPDAAHLLRYYGCFYHKEHLFIETELLGMNLLDLLKQNRNFFSLGRLQTIARMLLEGVARLNKMCVIHCDLKLENVLVRQLEPLEVKIADLGNSNFVHDSMTNYIQSRSYRAPEVILGLQPTQKIDVWSIGCIIAELWIGRIFFEGPHIQAQLANIQRLVGPWPQWMMEQGTLVDQYFLPQRFIFLEEADRIQVLVPRPCPLSQRLRTDDKYFLDFVRTLLEIDPTIRPDAEHALKHPFLTEARYSGL